MNELVLKRINNAIEQFDKKPINTKYLTTFMFYKDNLVTKKDIEKYLLARKYIKISDNYMFYFEDLIEYCKINKIEHINKLRSYMFSDFGVPYISLTDDDLSLILNNKEMQKHYSGIIYTSEENSDRKIVVKSDNGSYIVRNREDLIRFGLTNTYITYDLLKHYCILFPKESQFEIRYLLDDRDIKITSDKLTFEVYPMRELAKVAEMGAESRYYYPNTEYREKQKKDLSKYKSSNKINKDINIDSNKIFINLRLNEILATFINIGYEDHRISYLSSKKNFLSKHLSEFEKMGLLKREKKKKYSFLISDECMEISTKLKSLVKAQPNKNLFMDKSIMTQENIELFFSFIRIEFISILNRFSNFKFLFRLIDETSDFNSFNMMDMLEYCIVNKYEKEFLGTFIGKKGTAGKEAIIRGDDICCLGIDVGGIQNPNCNLCYRKHGINLSNIKNKLLHVRDNIAIEEYRKIESDPNYLRKLIEDPLVLKFLVRFGATYYNKNILRALKIIGTNVYMKSHGEYCPYKDEWRAYKNEV